MGKKLLLKPIENKILKAVVERKTFITSLQVAERAKVSWNTADKYLRKFYDLGWLTKQTVGNRTYWKANV